MVVARLAAATPGTLVLGSPCAAPFPGIAFHPVANTPALIRTLRRQRPAILEIHQQPRLALILSVLFPKTKILLFLHNDPLAMRGLKSTTARRLMLRRLHRVICVSAYLAGRYMAGLTGPGPAILPNPITLADLPPAMPRVPRILFVGRLVADKAPDVFIAACALALPELAGWSAMLIGGDRFGPASPHTPYVARIQAAAAAAGVIVTGPLPHADVLAAMAGASMVAVPSRWAEPFGLTALEALASGAALISTGRGGLGEVTGEVTGEAALIVPADDVAALTAAIIRLANDPALRATLGRAGRARAARFDTPVIAARLEDLRNAPALF